MREQLIQYVKLLFAGASGAEDIQQEILQNTLDRYDDLVAQGKSPEAAYRLAISGIGDINEILEGEPARTSIPRPEQTYSPSVEDTQEEKNNRLRRAVAVGMYILCPVPLFILGNYGNGTLGLTLMFILIAAATVLLMLCKDPDAEEDDRRAHEVSPQQALRKSIGSVVWAIGLAVYFVLSFVTGAWHITWVIFPIIGCVRGLINAFLDLKEVNNHEI